MVLWQDAHANVLGLYRIGQGEDPGQYSADNRVKLGRYCQMKYLLLQISGANRHDTKLLRETLEDCLRRVPRLGYVDDEHLCLDKGYESKDIKEMVEDVFGYVAHIRSRGEEKLAKRKRSKDRPRRWIVERTHSWFNRFRAILVRWEKKIENHIAILHIACAYITLSRAGVFG